MAEFQFASVRRKPRLCRNGLHDMDDPANRFLRPSGQQECRPCRNDQRRASYAAKKSQ